MNPRSTLVLLHDLLVTGCLWFFAYWLRFNFEPPIDWAVAAWRTLLWVLPIYGLSFARFGLYRGLWRFASIDDLKRLVMAASLASVVAGAVVHLTQANLVPRSVLVLHPLLIMLALGGARFLYRAWKDGHLFSLQQASAEPVLVIGAGDAGARLVREAAHSSEWHVVGMLDEDGTKHGRHIGGVPVLGPLAAIAEQAKRLNVKTAIMALPAAKPAIRRQAAEVAAAAGLEVLTVPAIADMLSGRVSISTIRRVELEDLLGRDPVQLDEVGLHRLLTGKVVFVTGAGGSIGSELCRQIAHFSPRLLVFYEVSEFALYRIEQEFAGQAIACAVGDVKDAARLEEIFRQYRPEVVFHAAAYKHVPMMENENAWEAVRNNVLGTYRVAEAAMKHGVGEFVLISTDKAVNPTNVMGASKRLAELVCQAVQRRGNSTKYVTVRFGNVLGSSGSVIPKFREQIAAGGPITVTHPDIIRYFMLIPEAAQLVLQAGLMGNGGETFVLDMGEPVKIVDLARDMIRLSGFSEDEIRIEFTGLRPGEKLYEELLTDSETTLPTPHPKLRIAKAVEILDGAWLSELEAWLAEPVRSEAEVKDGLRRRVPEYVPAPH